MVEHTEDTLAFMNWVHRQHLKAANFEFPRQFGTSEAVLVEPYQPAIVRNRFAIATNGVAEVVHWHRDEEHSAWPKHTMSLTNAILRACFKMFKYSPREVSIQIAITKGSLADVTRPELGFWKTILQLGRSSCH